MVQGLFESFHNNTVPSLQAVEEKARTNGCCSLSLSLSSLYRLHNYEKHSKGCEKWKKQNRTMMVKRGGYLFIHYHVIIRKCSVGVGSIVA